MVSSHTEDYILIQNKETGEQAIVDKRMSKYRKIAYGFLNYLKMNPRFVKHIILTQAVEAYQPKHLNNFMNSMRRYYGSVVYLWTVELQERRLEKYGDSVMHWHIIMTFDYDIDFGPEDIKRIQKYWKFGQVEVVPVRKPNIKYLMKYITKSLDTELSAVSKIRRIGSSQIAAWLKQSWNRILRAIDFFLPHNVTCDEFNDFYWQNGSAYVYAESEILGSKIRGEKVKVYSRMKSLWYKVDVLQGVPF